MADTKLESMVQRMIDAKASDEDIHAAIHLYKEEQNPTLSELKGVVEGLIPGVWGTIRGAFYDLPKGVIDDTMSVLKGETPEYAKSVVESMVGLPKEFMEASHEERGKIIGNIVGGGGLIGLAPKTVKPTVRATGSLMETVGKKGAWPIRMMGAHQMGSGNPLGAAVMAIPEVLQKGGAALQRLGGKEVPSKFMPSGTRDIETTGPIKSYAGAMRLGPSTGEAANRVPIVGTPAEASGRVQKVMAKEAAQANRPVKMTVDEQIADAQTQADIKASDVATREAKVRAEQAVKQTAEQAKAEAIAKRRAEAGVVAQPAKYGTSLRGTTPEGVVESESTTYTKPKTMNAGEGDPDYDAIKKKMGQETADAYLRNKLLKIQQGARADRTTRPPIQVDPQSVATLNQPQQGAVRLGRPAQEPIPPTKTKSSPISEVNPELTVDEEKAFGLPAGTRINKLAPEVKAKLLARRAERSAAYRMNAGMEKGARLASDLDEP